MAELKLSATELINLIKQNAGIPKEFTSINADGNGITVVIDTPIVGPRNFFITYQSFSAGILTCKITGKGLLDRMVIGIIKSIVTMIKFFDRIILAHEFVQVCGDNILIDLNDLLKKVNGLKINEVTVEDGIITIDISIKNVSDHQDNFEQVAVGRVAF